MRFLNTPEGKEFITRIKNKPENERSMPERILLKKEKILEKHPKYEGKIHSFKEKDVFVTSSKDVIIFLEIDKIKAK